MFSYLLGDGSDDLATLTFTNCILLLDTHTHLNTVLFIFAVSSIYVSAEIDIVLCDLIQSI